MPGSQALPVRWAPLEPELPPGQELHSEPPEPPVLQEQPHWALLPVRLASLLV